MALCIWGTKLPHVTGFREDMNEAINYLIEILEFCFLIHSQENVR